VLISSQVTEHAKATCSVPVYQRPTFTLQTYVAPVLKRATNSLFCACCRGAACYCFLCPAAASLALAGTPVAPIYAITAARQQQQLLQRLACVHNPAAQQQAAMLARASAQSASAVPAGLFCMPGIVPASVPASSNMQPAMYTVASPQQLQAQQQCMALQSMIAADTASSSVAGTAACPAWMNQQQALLGAKPEAAAPQKQQMVMLPQAAYMAMLQWQRQQQQMLLLQALAKPTSGIAIPTNSNGPANSNMVATPLPRTVFLQGVRGRSAATAQQLPHELGAHNEPGNRTQLLPGSTAPPPGGVAVCETAHMAVQEAAEGTQAVASAMLASKVPSALPTSVEAVASDSAATVQQQAACCNHLVCSGMVANGSGSSGNCHETSQKGGATTEHVVGSAPCKPPQGPLLLTIAEAAGGGSAVDASRIAGDVRACKLALQCSGGVSVSAGVVSGCSVEGVDAKDTWLCTYGYVKFAGVAAEGDQCECVWKVLIECGFGVYADDWDFKTGNVGELLEWANAGDSSSMLATAAAAATAASKDAAQLPGLVEKGEPSGTLCLNDQGAAGDQEQQQMQQQQEQKEDEEEENEGSQNNNMDVDDAASSEFDMNFDVNMVGSDDGASGGAGLDMNAGATAGPELGDAAVGAAVADSTAAWAAMLDSAEGVAEWYGGRFVVFSLWWLRGVARSTAGVWELGACKSNNSSLAAKCTVVPALCSAPCTQYQVVGQLMPSCNQPYVF
jgi:hypothetical protein